MGVPSDDLFKRYLEVGASILEMSRERAESFVRDLVASGEAARHDPSSAGGDGPGPSAGMGGEAADQADVSAAVKAEVRRQIDALGLATGQELAAVEARLSALEARVGDIRPPGPTRKRASAAQPKARSAAQPAAQPKARSAAQPKARPRRAPAPAPPASSPGSEAGISRSGAVAKPKARARPVPPAGAARDPKG